MTKRKESGTIELFVEAIIDIYVLTVEYPTPFGAIIEESWIVFDSMWEG